MKEILWTLWCHAWMAKLRTCVPCSTNLRIRNYDGVCIWNQILREFFGGCVNRMPVPTYVPSWKKRVSMWRKLLATMTKKFAHEPMGEQISHLQWQLEEMLRCYVLCVCVCVASPFSLFCDMCSYPCIYWDVQIGSHGLCLAISPLGPAFVHACWLARVRGNLDSLLRPYHLLMLPSGKAT